MMRKDAIEIDEEMDTNDGVSQRGRQTGVECRYHKPINVEKSVRMS